METPEVLEPQSETEAPISPLKNLWPAYKELLSLSGLIILLDQASKAVVRSQLAFNETWMPLEWLEPYARLIHWHNRGAAFGMFQSGGMVFVILALLVSGLILFYYPSVPREEWTLRLAMALQMGGALGNMIDRLRFGYVTDFFSISTFPVFNVADTSITAGVIVLLWGVWVAEIKAKAHAKEAIDDPEIDTGDTGSE